MNKCNEIINKDYRRYGGKPAHFMKMFLKYFRCAKHSKSRLIRNYYRLRYYSLSSKNGIQISPKTTIGEGLYIGHPFAITINSDAKLGKNINIHKGVTIGQENRGKRKGTPTIGNEVWFGVNSTIVGNITIGDDVLIAPNAFVNFDVPSHSVVIGNPGRIIHKEHATEGYINSKI